MNEQNEPSNTSTPIILPAKRKRGRPRKDGNLPKKDIEGSSKPALVTSVNEGIRSVQHIDSKPNDGSMIGRMVSGVIDGSFDAGYFLSVRIGNTGPFLRGVIFEPGRFTPVTSSNDIAPQAKIFHPIPIPSPQNRINDVGSQSVAKQPVQLGMQQPVGLCQVLPSVPQPSPSLVLRNQSPPTMLPIGSMSNNNISSPTLAERMMMQQNPRSTYGIQFQSSPPVENLRMVEQDDAMQVYEVSVQSEGLLVDTEPAKGMNPQSSSEPRANNVLHQKEITNQGNQSLNQDMGSGVEPSTQFRNDFNRLATEHHAAFETQNRQSEVKQNRDSYYELHQHIVIAEPQSLPDQKLTGIESGFQPRELIQNKLQDVNLELHETPVVTQTQHLPLENEQVKPDNEIRRPEHEMNGTPANTQHSIPMEPANREDQLDPGKLVHNELGSKNHGIKEAFVPSNSHFLPRELLSQSVELVTEKPSTPKNDIEDAIHFHPEAKTSENNQSNHIGKPIHNSTVHGELDSLRAENAREAMPFDLEIAAEETTWPRRPENQVSGFTACTTELNLVPGNAILRTETERNPGSLPESQQR